jgi:molybdate transport system substrate-binding protein
LAVHPHILRGWLLWAVALAALIVLVVLVARPGAQEAPRVYAAASLREAFPDIDPAPTYNFAGSNQLQTQIERGAPADVFASASPKEAEALHRGGHCSRPVAFATNVLVVLVPAGNPAGIRSLESLGSGPRRRLAIGAETVPVGAYTRKLLAQLRLSLDRHVVSNEPNVTGITSKVALGSADAGLAYMTDARAAGDRVEVIRIPESAQPPIRYLMCAVTRRGADTERANEFIRKVTSPAGRRVLQRWGFGLPE